MASNVLDVSDEFQLWRGHPWSITKVKSSQLILDEPGRADGVRGPQSARFRFVDHVSRTKILRDEDERFTT